ncbi:hypothetical protein [Pseudozobellia thermophila]|uniref:Lipoprotein n=1 Tax=Pseudozobellia thermophila TaxID=192903 RepID=A0A1M6B9Z0_9FLAO|nr:hypothetical protein [Pseudozobellia thermophila]SHI45560.1 hypothetical protein SAMN04488513_101340 [Pseudozobellia thermophila]
MKKCIYLLCAAVVTLMVSCSTDDDEIAQVASEAQISNKTGLSFANASGFEADQVMFKLRYGTGLEKEYGQSLVGYNYVELQEGPKTIYQIRVFKDGEIIPHTAYVNDSLGKPVEIKSTSTIQIRKDQLLQILLDHQ